MPFSLVDGCREFEIEKNLLSAECKKADGQTWVVSTIDLDQYFGNIEGKFTWGQKGFSQSADSISVVDGLLIAQLRTSSGRYLEDQVDLDEFFHDNDGILEVKPPSTSVDCSINEVEECCPPATEVEECPCPPKADEYPCPPKVEECPSPPKVEECPCPPKTEEEECPCPPKTEEEECPCPPKTEEEECPCPPKTEEEECPCPPKTEVEECPCPPRTEAEECPSTLDVKTLTVDTNITPGLDRSISHGSGSSCSTKENTTSNTFSSVNSSTTSISSSSSSVSKSAFHSSSFRSHSKHLLIEDTCSKFELKGTHLHVECRRLDGSVSLSSLDLDTCIGNNNGKLEWDMGGFSKSCESFFLEGFFLVARCRHVGDGTRYSTSRLDLRTRLRNADGLLIIVELEKKLSVMLSEVPWMKFKVIAEPDLSVFASHPVIQQTLVRIAETTVEHVTTEMHKQLTVAMEAAIKVVTASAMSHVSLQMQTLVQDSIGCATAHASVTQAEYLHSFSGYRSNPMQFNGTGLYHGGAYPNGAGTIGYNQSGFTPISQTGFQQGGFAANGQNGFNNTGFTPDNQQHNGFSQGGFMPSNHGFTQGGFNQNGFNQTGFTPVNQQGFTQTGFVDQAGFSQGGFAPAN